MYLFVIITFLALLLALRHFFRSKIGMLGFSPFFLRLQAALKSHGIAYPKVVLDKDRLDANIALIKAQPHRLPVRLVVKSLPSLPLLSYIASRLPTGKFMVFHGMHIKPLLENFTQADANFLCGKPFPSSFVEQLVINLKVKNQGHRLASIYWLVDTEKRFIELCQVAIRNDVTLHVVFEVEIGMSRGGFSEFPPLARCLQVCQDEQHIKFQGYMGYDAHVAKAPSRSLARKAFADSQWRYGRFIRLAKEAFPKLFAAEDSLVFNGGGSLTFSEHHTGSFTNEVAIGSVFLKPSDFDSFANKSFLPSAFIATPVLKCIDGTHVPFIGWLNRLWSWFDPHREMTYFVYGGYWKAAPYAPYGICNNPLFGHSSNQEMLNAPRASDLNVDDFVFYLPQQSEAVLEEFGDLVVVADQAVVDIWPVLRV